MSYTIVEQDYQESYRVFQKGNDISKVLQGSPEARVQSETEQMIRA